MVDKKKLEAMNSLFIDTSNVTFKGLLYGDPGTTKTTLAASIGDRVLVVVADPDGYQSLLNHPELGLGTRVKPIKYAGISQLEFLADVFVEGGTQFDEFDTVLLDTMSNIASLDRDTVTKAKMQQKGDSFTWEDQQWPIYNQTTMRVTAALLKLMLSPVNVVMTAHAIEREINGRQVTRPKFSPEIFSSIAGQCSMIAYVTANEAGVDGDGTVKYKRKIQYHPTRNIVAKTRIGGLPVSESLGYGESDVLNSRLRQIVEEWKVKGGSLTTEKEASVERPDTLSVNPPVATEDPATKSLEDFNI
jgi:hypothetical protein